MIYQSKHMAWQCRKVPRLFGNVCVVRPQCNEDRSPTFGRMVVWGVRRGRVTFIGSPKKGLSAMHPLEFTGIMGTPPAMLSPAESRAKTRFFEMGRPYIFYS